MRFKLHIYAINVLIRNSGIREEITEPHVKRNRRGKLKDMFVGMKTNEGDEDKERNSLFSLTGFFGVRAVPCPDHMSVLNSTGCNKDI